jgi:GMP synthase-like glutamine amidotransferase
VIPGRRVPFGGVRGLVVGNGNDFDPGFVGQRFRERGYSFVECFRERPEQWPSLDGIDLVLSLGSEWNVYRRETEALVDAEAALLRETTRREVPLFAICFGAQVLSHALTGEVTRLGEPEIGWCEIDALPGHPDAVAVGPWVEWHYDTFTVPEGFRELARTAAGPQLVVGPRVLATQFHPECTETMVAAWLGMGGADQLRALGRDPADFMAETRENTVASRANAHAVVDWFLDDVATS